MKTATLATRIDRVTVYRNGALVTRAGALTLEAELPLWLEIPGLPLLFNSDSVRVRAQPGVQVGAVEERPELEGGGERSSAQEAARRQLLLKRKTLIEERKAWQALQTQTDTLALPARLPKSARGGGVDLSGWTALTDFAQATRARCDEALSASRAQLRAIDDQLADLERVMASEAAAAPRYTRRLATTLRGEVGAGPLQVEVEYFVPGARWLPSYALNLSGDRAEFQLFAQVAQATGEDWTAAAVSVCTADLRRETRLPRLGSWRIGREAPAPNRGWRPLPEDLDRLFGDADLALAVRPAPPLAPAPEPAWAEQEITASEALDDHTEPMDAAEGAAGPPPPEQALFGAAAPPAAARALSVSLTQALPPPARKSRGFGVGGGGAARPAAPKVKEEAPPPPPLLDPGALLDYAWLRLAPWEDRARRGRLLPVDAFSDLRALAEARGQTDRYLAVEAALRALRADLARLNEAPVPAGCVPLSGSSFHHRYPASPRVKVAADGRFHQILIASADAVWTETFRAVPRASPQCFRFADLKNPLAAPLPAGPLRISQDGAFLASSALRPTGAGGALSLNLGVEDRLRIARNSAWREEEQGVFTSAHVGVTQVHTELQSRLDRAAKITVLERLPLAEEGAALTVRLEAATPPPSRRDLDDAGAACEGALAWDLALAPGQKAEIRYSYTVKLPARMEIVGGNRREP